MTIANRAVRLELTGAELRQMLGPVLAHASTDDPFIPVLTYIGIEVTGGELYLIGTDRYTLGVIRHPLTEPAGRFTLAVPANALRTMLRTIKAREAVELGISPDAVTIRHTVTAIEYRALAADDIEPIDWRSLLAKALTANAPREAGDTAVSPAYLARFRAATRDGEPLMVRALGHVVVVACGEHFIGAVAPLRPRADTADVFEHWRTVLTLPAADRVAA